MKQILIVCAVVIGVLMVLQPHAGAQLIEISSSLNPVGSGARAMGMGGAFIAVADDATAASWNPAGLVQLEKPEMSGVGQYFYRSQDYESFSHPEINGTNNMNAAGLNYASAAYPFVLFNRNMIVSVNYQRLYELNKDIDFDFTWDIGGEPLSESIQFEQDGYLYALSPAFAVQVTPSFYLGVTVNFWDDIAGDNGWSNSYQSTATGMLGGFTMEEQIDWRQDYSFEGFNAHVGFLWNVFGSITVGGVLKTPFEADLERNTSFTQSQEWITEGIFTQSDFYFSENLEMNMPLSYGFGVQYRHSDALTLALDVYRTDWSEFYLQDENGVEINPINGRPLSEGSLDDTTQVRFGAEYLFINRKYTIPVRFGAYYDPEPAVNDTDSYYGISVGSGIAMEKFAIDVAYNYRFGNDVTGDLPAVPDNEVDVSQHMLMLSAIFYFN